MIPEIGQFVLIAAFVIALVQTIVGFFAASRNAADLAMVTVRAAQLQFLLVAAAFACLVWSYVVTDLSVANVVANSHSAKPLLYKITGVWGNHEGSLLLWVLILSLFGAALARFDRTIPSQLRAYVLAVMALIGIAFLLFLILTSNPFARLLNPPSEGQDLNPILQDPALAVHPPFLYLGYVGLSVTYAFAIAGLLQGRIDNAWARRLRPWVLLAWIALTIGIALGSWWAYYELGWGGFWFWDPVENASLMPWLAATALLHSALIVEKRASLKSWTVLLAILAFSLSLMGTFLVRSGVLTSVHSFANDPLRGIFILLILTLAVGGALALFAGRAARLTAEDGFVAVSREGALVFNNIVLSAACAAVFIGTLYPLFLDAFNGPRISVGPPYFVRTFVPLMLPLLLLIPLGPLLSWKKASLAAALRRLLAPVLAAVLAGLVAFVCQDTLAPLGPLGVALAFWIIFGSGVELERMRLSTARMSLLATMLAHGGVGITLLGIVGVSAWRGEEVAVLRPGESTDIGGYHLVLEKVLPLPGPNYQSEKAFLRVEKQGQLVDLLMPERRYYPVKGATTSEAAIRTNVLSDLYAVLGVVQPSGGFALRLFYNPLAPLIWLGALVMAMGGLCALVARRKSRMSGAKVV